MTEPVRVEVDGRPATAGQLAVPGPASYGHFTAMQVRGGRVRRLDLHLARLDAQTRELFGTGLPGELVRERIRQALRDLADASLRVTVFRLPGATQVSTMVIVRPPVEPPTGPVRLLAVAYQRPLAQIKHTGTFGQIHYGELARAKGYDDALLTTVDGVISETSTANIGFLDDAGVLWPDAPLLLGTTMQLLEDGPLPTRRAPVRLADLPRLRGAFVANSIGVTPVSTVDDLDLPLTDDRLAALRRRWSAVPTDEI
ncbi:MAG: aminotransferase class IV [Micromonosporaceae bacterium]|nr:aminotransferase class IV [Micromonosporaceae bacterium]